MSRPKVKPPKKPVENRPPQHRWWRSALIAAILSTSLFAFLGPRGPHSAQHAIIVFVAVYLAVWFCNPAEFFRRMSWVALMLVGGVVLVYFLHTKDYFGPQSSATFVILHAPWLVGVFTGAAVLFALLEYLQHRSAPEADVVGEEIVKPDPKARGSRRRADDDVPKFPPPAPFKRNKRIADQDTLPKIVERYAALPAPSADPQVTVRMLRTEPDRVLDRLDAALFRADSLAGSGDAEAGAVAEAARNALDIEPLQSFLIAEADRRGYKTREDATAYVEICREIAGIAEVRGDLETAHRNLEEIIRLVPEDTDVLNRLGRACLRQNKLATAEEAFQKILVLSTQDEWRAMAFTNLGTVFHLQGDLGEAERVFDRALEIDEQIGDVKGMAANYANLGRLCRERGNLGKAEKMFAVALEIDEGLELLASA